MAELLVDGQRAVPRRLLAAGFRFRHEEPDGALRDLLAGKPLRDAGALVHELLRVPARALVNRLPGRDRRHETPAAH